MAYSGTGTQADPYIPTTITSLYEVLNLCNSDTSASDYYYYIKLTTDLDCADDPNYIGYMNDGIFIGQKICKLYTENNSKIIGLTVKGGNFIRIDDSSNYENYRRIFAIEGIYFKNCFYKASSYLMLLAYSNAYGSIPPHNMLYDVKMSVYVIRSAANALIRSDRISHSWNNKGSAVIKNCSFYFNIRDTQQTTIVYGAVLKNNNIILDYISGGCADGYNDYMIYGHYQGCEYNSFICKNAFVRGDSNTRLLSNTSYSYLCFLNCTFSSGTAYINNVSHCIVASDDFTNLSHSDVTNTINYLSISELQDNQKLLDIGFLP